MFAGCSDNDASDEEMLKKDEQTLNVSLQTEKVIAYKFRKIMLRAYADPDSTSSKQARRSAAGSLGVS